MPLQGLDRPFTGLVHGQAADRIGPSGAAKLRDATELVSGVAQNLWLTRVRGSRARSICGTIWVDVS